MDKTDKIFAIAAIILALGLSCATFYNCYKANKYWSQFEGRR